MKKIIYASFLLVGLVFSCEYESVRPQQNASKGNTTPDAVKENSLLSETTTSCSVEELYVARYNRVYAVDYSTGSRCQLLSDHGFTKLASTKGFIYGVWGPTLYKINPSTGSYSDLTVGATWPNTEAMTALGDYLYIVEAGRLYRVHATNGSLDPGGFSNYPDGWTGTEAMAATNGKVFAVQGDVLWQVNVSTGAVSTFSDYPNGWGGVEAMAAGGTELYLGIYAYHVYLIHGGTLWRVNVSNGDVAPFSDYPNGWEGTTSLTFKNGYLFGIQAGAMWKVNCITGGVTQLGNPTDYPAGWDGPTAMAARL